MISEPENNRPLTYSHAVIGVLTGTALLLASYSAACRYLFPALAQGWVDELVIYFIVWAMWLSGHLLVSEGTHVRADLIGRFVAPVWSARLAAIVAAIGFMFCCLMTYGGVMVVLLSVRLGEYSDSTLALPLWLYYLGFPVGMLLMAWQYLRLLVGKERGGV